MADYLCPLSWPEAGWLSAAVLLTALHWGVRFRTVRNHAKGRLPKNMPILSCEVIHECCSSQHPRGPAIKSVHEVWPSWLLAIEGSKRSGHLGVHEV